MSNSLFVTCSSCFAKNRVPSDKLLDDGACGKCKKKIISGLPIDLTDQNVFRFIQNNDLPVVVDFWADWCGPCLSFAPHFKQAASDNRYALRFAKVKTQNEQQDTPY